MEFSDLGKHCKLCKQQDFLPFMCDHCNEWFCKDHRTETDHQCPVMNSKNIETTKTKVKKSKKCIKCKEPQLVPYRCTDCNKIVCMIHRYSDNHNCVLKTPKSCREENLSPNMLERMFAWVK